MIYISIQFQLRRNIDTYLIQYWHNNGIKNHNLIRSWTEDLVEMICLVTQCARPHGQFHGPPFHSICADDDTAVFAHFAVAASSTSDDDIDIRFRREVIGVEITVFALDAIGLTRWGADS